jgi:hypothetical protein
MKCYSKRDAKKLTRWSVEDMQDYQNEIGETLRTFLNIKEEDDGKI